MNTIPIIRLWNVLLVPVQGDLADHEAERLADNLLSRIHREGAAGLVIDLSGVWMLDSHLCAVVVRLARSAHLLGTPTVISGLSPEIALTLQSMGVDLSSKTARTLEEALVAFGLEPKWKAGPGDDDVALMRRLIEQPASEGRST